MNDVQKFAKIIEKIQFAMMTTISANDRHLNSRPMTLLKTEFDGDLWFFAGRASQPVEDIQEEPMVNLAFSDPKTNAYMSVSGRAEMVLDRAKAEELWNPLFKAWFPKGLEDPDLCMIKVEVESADYWESPSSPVAKLAGFAKVILTGQRAGDALGKREHWS
jgi:general stress protein 26